MDFDGLEYDVLFILKETHKSEYMKKYKEYKNELMQENTYREMLLLLKLIKSNYLPCKIKLRHLPSEVFNKKTM